ncbi:hypothetical protein SDRG_03890 [Saprolegnia diclina VS20]|uniref:SEC7 domain-containing protein n=1 Tax=Saprolegnia diclina (strain VS20) TaxID=1156394 RepID=T0S803_SAPDV|nr:hypothetical protein SDRG_03890 [Saprolegnia diclina VS20]EQC38932.1 hypothetical protein SDRG_03890 [Saprolegnia diclina VS20]|eukprot:XP_008607756.1 hypothetical protein SDRG_03890 [Saprolegnia diclina VS20]
MEALRCATLSGIQTLVHVFRRHYKFLKVKSGQVTALASLRAQVQQWTDPHDFEPQTVLRPFLDIIRNENTTGPLTRSAMEAVCSILHVYDENATLHGIPMQHALADVLDAVTQCRFQETEPNSDQYVLLTVVRVLDMVLQCRAAATLTDDTIWHVVEALFAIARSKDTRISGVIRGVATDSLQRMMHIIFDPTMLPQAPSRSFGLPCAVKVLGFLCQKIQPTSKSSERELLLSLQLLQSILLKLGNHLRDVPALLSYAQDELCGAILNWLRLGSSPSSGSIDVPLACLTVLRLVWCYLRPVLKLQWEVMLMGLIPGIVDRRLALEWRLELLQCLVDFLADASFVIDVFVQYDCDSDRSNVLELLLSTLTSLVKPSVPISDANDFVDMVDEPEMADVALQGFWNLLHVLHMRTRTEFDLIVGPAVEASENVLARRERKKRFQEAIAAFNAKPLTGISLLEAHGFLPSPTDASSLARLLRSLPPGLDKNCVGQYLGTMGKAGGALTDTIEFHQELLPAYVAAFDFDDVYLVDALRMFLSSFRLPGEAQQIDRILECFSKQAFAQCKERTLFGTSVDVPYLLSFSIIMLQTDLHNTNIRDDRKMSLADFLKNNLNYGLDGASPLPEEYLTSIYHAIRTRPLRTCDDADEVTSERWADLQRSDGDRTLQSYVHTPEYDAHVLDFVAHEFVLPLMASLDGASIPDALTHLVAMAETAASLHAPSVLMAVVTRLGEYSTLCETPDDEALEAVVYTFCNDPVASSATLGLLQLWQSCHMSFDSSAWTWFLSALARLREYHLLPTSFLQDRRSGLSTESRAAYLETTRAAAKRKAAKHAGRSTSAPPSGFFTSVSRFFALEPLSAPSSPAHVASSLLLVSARQVEIDDLFFPPTTDETDVLPMVTQPWIDEYYRQCPIALDFYDRMASLPVLDAFLEAACTAIERVVLPPAKAKASPAVLSPGGAIFLEQIAMRVIAASHPRVITHVDAVVHALDPFIRGNLVVQSMGYEAAVFLLETLLAGVVASDLSFALGVLESLDMDLLSVVARPVLSSVLTMPLSTPDVWQSWLRVLLRCSNVPDMDDYATLCVTTLDASVAADVASAHPTLMPLLTLVAHAASIHVDAPAAIAVLESLLVFEASLYGLARRHGLPDTDVLSVLGAMCALLTHPSTLSSEPLRLQTLSALRKAMLEVPDATLAPSSWLALLRFGVMPLTGVDVPHRVNDDALDDASHVLLSFALEAPLTSPATVAIMDMLVLLFLHHLDEWVADAAVDFATAWQEVLAVCAVQLATNGSDANEALIEQLRNMVHVVYAVCQDEAWFLPSVADIATLCPQVVVWDTTTSDDAAPMHEEAPLVEETAA